MVRTGTLDAREPDPGTTDRVVVPSLKAAGVADGERAGRAAERARRNVVASDGALDWDAAEEACGGVC